MNSKVFELTLVGFDGSTDETDHLVKWLVANNEEDAAQIARDKGWDIQTGPNIIFDGPEGIHPGNFDN